MRSTGSFSFDSQSKMLDQFLINKNMATGDAPIKLNPATVQFSNRWPCDWIGHEAYLVRIEAEGPFGAMAPLEYVISVDDLHGSGAAPPGNLHAVAAELREMTKATKELNEIIRKVAVH